MTLFYIGNLKKNYCRNFPDTPLAKVLAEEKDLLSQEELLAKVATWLILAEVEAKRYG